MRNNYGMVAKLSAALVVALGFSAPAQAGLILGGSTLLTPSYVTDLEGWLGEGPLTLTNIFTKTSGSTAASFHAAADGRGRTFTVLRATDDGVTSIIGGYNPQSWSSSNTGYNYTYPDADRTAFLFNLSNGTLHRQLLNRPGDTGQYQTFSNSTYGPTFGGGHDLFVGCDGCAYSALNVGYSLLYSYAAPNRSNEFTSLVSGASFDGYNMEIAELEVFSIGPNVDVPEPSTIALIGMALLSMFGLGLMRRRADA